MTLAAIDEAVKAGARVERACEIIGLSVRTVQYWRLPETAEDRRAGPRTTPSNKLTAGERKRLATR